MCEEITTRDESSHIAVAGQRVLPNGGISADGPPTTLSDTGVDRMVFAQANITRDNTKFVNGAIVGDRNVFQVTRVYIIDWFPKAYAFRAIVFFLLCYPDDYAFLWFMLSMKLSR